MSEERFSGHCHCGAVTFEVSGPPDHHALCHCADCRMCAGAPMVGWYAVREEAFRLTGGEPVEYASSAHGRRFFCGRCGSGLFYRNAEVLPGIVDVQSALLDRIDELVPEAHIQLADAVAWEGRMADLPRFARFPGMDEV